MTFLNPAMLWFLAGGSIPIIIHLLYRQRYRVVHWAAMEFLLAAIRKTQRRLRLENLLLLLVRFLILTLLALAIARPLLSATPLMGPEHVPVHHIFVLDNSYSMRALAADKSLWARARDTAIEMIQNLPHRSEDDRFSVLTMSERPQVIIPAGNDADLIMRRLRELEPSDFGPGLLATLELLKRQQQETRPGTVVKIHFLTDLQRNAWTEESERAQQAARELLKTLSERLDTQVFLLDVAGRPTDNHAIVDVRVEDRVVTTRDPARITVEVMNFSDAVIRELPVAIRVDGNPQPPRSVTLGPGGRASVEFVHRFTEPGPHVVTAFLDPPDYLAVDDQRHLALDVRDRLRVLGVDGDPGTTPRGGELGAYSFSMDPLGEGRFSVTVQPRLLFDAAELAGTDVLVLANVDALPADDVARIEEFVRAGGGLWIALGPRVDAEAYNELFWRDGTGLLPARLEAPFGHGTPETRIHLAEIARAHPIFAGRFNEAMFGALRQVHFTRAWRLLEEETLPTGAVVARFDDGLLSAAILQNTDPDRVGDGRVLVTTFPLDGDWNVLFYARAIYLPFVREATAWLARPPHGTRNLFIGDHILARFPMAQFRHRFALNLPRSGTVTLYPPEPGPNDRFFSLFYPSPPPAPGQEPAAGVGRGLEEFGIYRLTADPSGGQPGIEPTVALFACNPQPRQLTGEALARCESRLEPILVEELRTLYPEFRFTALAPGAREGGSAKPLRPEGFGIWRQLLWLVAGLIVVESLMAMWFGRRQQ